MISTQFEKAALPEQIAADRFGAWVFHVWAIRPANVPADWVVFNAPRPLPGHQDWTNGCIHGAFFSAVDLAAPDAERIVRDIISLDGWALHYTTQADLEAWWPVFARQEGLDQHSYDPDDVRRAYFYHHRKED